MRGSRPGRRQSASDRQQTQPPAELGERHCLSKVSPTRRNRARWPGTRAKLAQSWVPACRPADGGLLPFGRDLTARRWAPTCSRGRCWCAAAQHDRRRPSQLREAGQRLLERDAAFHAGQRRAEAEVRPDAERDVLLGLALDVELVGVVLDPVVAAGGAGQQQDLRARRQRLAVQLDRTRERAALHRRRRLVAQQFLDRRREQRRSRPPSRPAGPDGRPGSPPPSRAAWRRSRCRR